MRRERKNIRLNNFDYRTEYFHFLTICTKDRQWFLGNIKDKNIALSPVGEMVNFFWMNIPNHFPHVILDEFVIMPNHVHGIIKLDYSKIGTCHGRIGTCHGMSLLSNNVELSNNREIKYNRFSHPVPGSVSVIINHFKSAVKRWCNKNGHESFNWQPRFYDHIINNRKDLGRIRKYIKLNPSKWDE